MQRKMFPEEIFQHLSPDKQALAIAFLRFLSQDGIAETNELKRPKAIKAGTLKGTFQMAPDFDAPMDEFKDYM